MFLHMSQNRVSSAREKGTEREREREREIEGEGEFISFVSLPQ